MSGFSSEVDAFHNLKRLKDSEKIHSSEGNSGGRNHEGGSIDAITFKIVIFDSYLTNVQQSFLKSLASVDLCHIARSLIEDYGMVATIF